MGTPSGSSKSTGTLGAGITIAPGAGAGEAIVVNRSGKNLRAGLLVLPHGGATYFGRLRDGERVSTTAGRVVSSTPAGRTWEAAIASPSYRTTDAPASARWAAVASPTIPPPTTALTIIKIREK